MRLLHWTDLFEILSFFFCRFPLLRYDATFVAFGHSDGRLREDVDHLNVANLIDVLGTWFGSLEAVAKLILLGGIRNH